VRSIWVIGWNTISFRPVTSPSAACKQNRHCYSINSLVCVL
jgi:hypothetical protein